VKSVVKKNIQLSIRFRY